MLTFFQSHKKDLIFVAIILIVSAVFRIIFYQTVPPNISGDEVTNLSDVYKILYSPGNHLLSFFGDGSIAGINFYPVVFLIKFLGISYSIYYLRFFISFCSVLALICFYLILKKYVNTFIAFAFSLLLANNYVFLNFSRTAWVNQITIFTILATILFLLNFYKTKSIKWLVLSAIFSGITLYGYHYGRIFITFLIIFIIFYSLLRKGVRHLRKAALFFLISLVIFSPYLYKIILNSGESILRRPVATFAFSQTKLTPEGGLFSVSFNQLTYTLKGFILLDPAVMSRGVENTRYLPLLTPPVDLIVELLFFAGLIIFFIRFKKFKIFYIIFISVLLTEFFTEYPPNFSRGLIYVPLTYLIASLSANKIFLYLDSKSKKLALTFFLLLTIFLSSYNIFKYFSWMNQDSLTNARQPAITYYEFPYWQKYQIKRVTSGLNPITNYEWYDVRKLYLPNQIKKE